MHAIVEVPFRSAYRQDEDVALPAVSRQQRPQRCPAVHARDVSRIVEVFLLGFRAPLRRPLRAFDRPPAVESDIDNRPSSLALMRRSRDRRPLVACARHSHCHGVRPHGSRQRASAFTGRPREAPERVSTLGPGSSLHRPTVLHRPSTCRLRNLSVDAIGPPLRVDVPTRRSQADGTERRGQTRIRSLSPAALGCTISRRAERSTIIREGRASAVRETVGGDSPDAAEIALSSRRASVANGERAPCRSEETRRPVGRERSAAVDDTSSVRCTGDPRGAAFVARSSARLGANEGAWILWRRIDRDPPARRSDVLRLHASGPCAGRVCAADLVMRARK